eukprot:12045336-Alexandrium_andersonii.AAC.1
MARGWSSRAATAAASPSSTRLRGRQQGWPPRLLLRKELRLAASRSPCGPTMLSCVDSFPACPPTTFR